MDKIDIEGRFSIKIDEINWNIDTNNKIDRIDDNLHFFGLGEEKSAFRLVPLMGVLNPSRSTKAAESKLSLLRATAGLAELDPWWTKMW